MTSSISPSADLAKFSSPKRARLSLKHRGGRHLPSAPNFEVDVEEKMVIDREQDENISPNADIYEVTLNPYIKDRYINKDCAISALGLPNVGNTCFIGTIVQVLRYTPNMVDTLHSLVISQSQLALVSSDPKEVKPDDFFNELHMVYKSMKKEEEFLYKGTEENYTSTLQGRMESFVASLREITSLFEEGVQNDAHEFLLFVISHFDTISTKVKEIAKVHCKNTRDFIGSSPSPPKDKLKMNKRRLLASFIESGLFQKTSSFDLGFVGSTQRTIKCLECETRSERLESFTDLEVRKDDFITEETVDIFQCLFQREILSGNLKYRCEECLHFTEAQLFSQIMLLPSVLVLHCLCLKQSRFHSQIEKDNTKITIPLLVKASEKPDVFLNATDETYHLYAVIMHIGASQECGHYVSFIKEMPEHPQMSDNALLKSAKQNYYNAKSCCEKDKSVITEDSMYTNDWLYFDDREVFSVNLGDSSVFPYYDFMTTSASPFIVFYYKK